MPALASTPGPSTPKPRAFPNVRALGRVLALAGPLWFVLFPSLALAQTNAPAGARAITARDLWALQRVSAPAVSPDGRTVAVVVQEWSIEKNRSTASLWLVPTTNGSPRRLTTAPANDSAPAWSPDGTRLAFVSKRGDDETAALYVIPVNGGEAEEVLEMPYGLLQPRWLPDGEHVIAGTTVIPEFAGSLSTADRAAMAREVKRRKDSKVTAQSTEHRIYRFFDKPLTDQLATRLIRIHVRTREVRDLTPGWDRWFQPNAGVAFEVSPDGKSLVFVANSTPPPYYDPLNSDLYLVSTDGSGSPMNLTSENPGADEGPSFAPDGRSIYYLSRKTTFHNGESLRIRRLDLGTGRSTALTEKLDYSFEEVRVAPDGRTLWAIAEERGIVPIFRLNPDGTGLEAVHRTGSSGSLVIGPGAVVALNNTTDRPDELLVLDPVSRQVRVLTTFNAPLLGQVTLGRVEDFWFKGAAGARIHGRLVYPPGYDPARKYPLVQVLHGGPHTMSRDGWSYRWNAQALAAPGYVVAQINRHGSTGFGEKFAQSIVGRWGKKPFEDIMKGTDHLLKTVPNLDPKRVAATGASYGGYLAAWILGHTDRFACIIDHAGVNNAYTQFGSDIPQGFAVALGGSPWKDADKLLRNNPMSYAHRFRTPTLITHGELDYRVPYGSGLELYAALQAQQIPSRLVIFPNENHWILSPQNSIHWYWEYHDWLARHLGLPRSAKPEFGTPGSGSTSTTNSAPNPGRP